MVLLKIQLFRHRLDGRSEVSDVSAKTPVTQPDRDSTVFNREFRGSVLAVVTGGPSHTHDTVAEYKPISKLHTYTKSLPYSLVRHSGIQKYEWRRLVFDYRR